MGIGAYGLNREVGAKPTRSRRCMGSILQDVTEVNTLGRRRNTMNLSQKNCLSNNHRFTHDGWGGGYAQCVYSVPACLSRDFCWRRCLMLSLSLLMPGGFFVFRRGGTDGMKGDE